MSNQSALAHITIYTDGGCSPNPGPGGWAVILRFDDQPPQELSGSHPQTTNNQMELQAAIEALNALKTPHYIDFYTDSTYLRRGITEWAATWQANNWQRGKTEEVKNIEHWQQLITATQHHQISWHWTKGHAGNKWNERADELASAMIPRAALPLDDQTAVHLFTAAAYNGKTGIGGWGVVLKYQNTTKTLSGQEAKTSANRMHLQAAIAALQALKKPFPIHLYTTSDYLKDGATLWIGGWQSRNWQTKEGKPVSNRDLWEELATLMQQHPVKWHSVDKDAMPPEMKQAKTLTGGLP